jgi:hypothetical protein
VTAAGRFRLQFDGQLLEVSARRDGLRTRVALYVDGDQVAEGSGIGRVLTSLPVATPATLGSTMEPNARQSDEIGREPPRPTVLVLSALPGTVSRALLLVPREDSTDDDTDPAASDGAQPEDDLPLELPKGVAGLAGLVAAERHPFAPPPGSFAARLLIFQRDHPRLYASRHIVLAVAKVTALLGLAVVVRLLLQPVLGWITERLPDIDLPSIPWPDVPWPDFPWPDIDLPELAVPAWLRVIIGTAKFWLPVLIAIGVAAAETKRRRAAATREGDRDAHS